MICCPHCKKEFEPLVLDGAKQRGHTLLTFDKWIESLNGADAIPEDHQVFKFSRAAGIPDEFLSLAWSKFQANYRGNKKKYKDWGVVFRRSVEGNWFDLWRINRSGEYYLTTVGLGFSRAARVM